MVSERALEVWPYFTFCLQNVLLVDGFIGPSQEIENADESLLEDNSLASFRDRPARHFHRVEKPFETDHVSKPSRNIFEPPLPN